MQATRHIHVTGVVQGVGFRPFVYGLATRLDLRGWVCNTSAGVEIVIQGENAEVDLFAQSLTADAPPLARIDQVSAWDEVDGHFTNFEIREIRKCGRCLPTGLTRCGSVSRLRA